MCDIINKDLGIDIGGIRFHAVHRVGRKLEGRCRLIIARFLSREDRDEVWRNRGKLKHSVDHTDAYVMEDFARAIQEERKTLIKAMMKARNKHGLTNAKVIGRFLFLNNEKYNFQNVPDFLKCFFSPLSSLICISYFLSSRFLSFVLKRLLMNPFDCFAK